MPLISQGPRRYAYMLTYSLMLRVFVRMVPHVGLRSVGIKDFSESSLFYLRMFNSAIYVFTPLGSFIHEVGATVGYTLDAIPTMDETSISLYVLAQGLRLDTFD